MTGSTPKQELDAFAPAVLGATADGPALPKLLSAHPQAANLLTDALLAGPPPEVPPAPPPAAGERRIGPYRIDGELGRGGQAVVYAATDTRLGRPVALKVLHADAFLSPFRAQRFRAEAETTSRLDHPGICPVYEVGEDDGRPWLAMRRLDGRTLAATIQAAAARPARPFALDLGPGTASADTTVAGSRRPGALVATLRLFESIASALHAAHRAGVTHRDVKPGNVVVQPDGTAVLLDFGLAADESRTGATLTRTGDVFGTPAYMAPEQCRGERCDARSDVFSLGATMFEALTGERAFAGETHDAIVRAILGGRVPDPRRQRRDLPPELGTVVRKALDPDPGRRYATAEEFAQDLRRVRELRPVLAAPPGVWLLTRRFCQRNPWLVAMAGVLVVAATISLWFAADASARSHENQLVLLRDELHALVTAYGRLQPVAEHRTAAMEWTAQARALVARRTEVERMRDDLRRDATRGGDTELDDDGVVLRQELERLDAIESARAAGRGRSDLLSALAEEAPQRRDERDRVAAAVAERRAWHLPDRDRRLLHAACVRLLQEIDAFAGATGQLASAQRELAGLATASVEWDAVVADVRQSAVYRHLELRPQRELVPLRKQPATGFWEFSHPRSGPPPRIRADGSLEFADDTGIVLVLLPGGPTRVGAQRTDPHAPRHDPRIRPVEDYLVELDLEPFFLAVHEVTRAQWIELEGRDPSSIPIGTWGMTPGHPVVDVTWSEAAEVLGRSTLTLPTEAQWEYAARAMEHSVDEARIDPAATRLLENLYDAAATLRGVSSPRPPLAGDDGFARSAPVGSFAPNGFGLHDMRGNVQEWCLDPEAYPNRDLLGARDGVWLAPSAAKHSVRGFGWLNDLAWSPLTTRTITSDPEKDRGLRAARRLDP